MDKHKLMISDILIGQRRLQRMVKKPQEGANLDQTSKNDNTPDLDALIKDSVPAQFEFLNKMENKKKTELDDKIEEWIAELRI